MRTRRKPNRTSTLRRAIVGVFVLLLLPPAGMAGKFNRALSIGDQAPSWSGLVGVDGRKRALADFADAKLVVLIFTCNHCPVATANQARLVALQRDFSARGVQLVAICSSPGDEDSLPAMKERAEAEGYNFPYLRDADQSAARSYGARQTPTALVLDGDRKVRYMGSIDDHWQDAAQVRRDYLRDALEALLAGQKVPIAETRPQGCEIPLVESKSPPAKP